MSDAEKFKYSHHWTGWPGAMCMHCGCGDPMEQAMADGEVGPDENMKGLVYKNKDVELRIAADMVCPVGFSPNICPQCSPDRISKGMEDERKS